jgi:hypothetical protein
LPTELHAKHILKALQEKEMVLRSVAQWFSMCLVCARPCFQTPTTKEKEEMIQARNSDLHIKRVLKKNNR